MYYLVIVLNFDNMTIRNPFLLLFSQFRKAQKCRNLTSINIEYPSLSMLHTHRQLFIIIIMIVMFVVFSPSEAVKTEVTYMHLYVGSSALGTFVAVLVIVGIVYLVRKQIRSRYE